MSDLQDYLNDPARDALIMQVRKKIDELGVNAIYYQYISITGRIMGKIIPVRHWERMAGTGMQTWLGGVTNVFADKEGNLIGFAPNASDTTRPARSGHFLPATLEQASRAGVLHGVFQP